MAKGATITSSYLSTDALGVTKLLLEVATGRGQSAGPTAVWRGNLPRIIHGSFTRM